MIPRISFESGIQRKVEQHLSEFAKKGLRTLVMGQRILDNSEYEEIMTEIAKT